MENLNTSDPSQSAGQPPPDFSDIPPQEAQTLPPQMFTTAAQLLDLTDSMPPLPPISHLQSQKY